MHILGGGEGAHKLSPNMGGAHIRGQFSTFLLAPTLIPVLSVYPELEDCISATF